MTRRTLLAVVFAIFLAASLVAESVLQMLIIDPARQRILLDPLLPAEYQVCAAQWPLIGNPGRLRCVRVLDLRLMDTTAVTVRGEDVR